MTRVLCAELMFAERELRALTGNGSNEGGRPTAGEGKKVWLGNVWNMENMEVSA